MFATTFETVKSCYFEGVEYQCMYNEVPGTNGNESFFTVEAVYGQYTQDCRFEDLGKEFATLAEAIEYARKFDHAKALERDEIRYNVQ